MILKNDRLAINIQEPGSIYKRSRFDWSAIISSIIVDGQVEFCSQEASGDNRGTEGLGLTYEFGINKPVGFDEIKPGDFFPKIGVGFLIKESDREYDFFYDYKIDPVEISVSQDLGDQVVFIQDAPIRNGYGWNLERSVKIIQNKLIIDSFLKNTGDKKIVTNEYCHNFVKLGSYQIGSDYLFNVDKEMNLIEAKGIIQHNAKSISPDGVPESWLYCATSQFAKPIECNWSLSHRESPLSIKVNEQFDVSKFALWGMKHVISPEFFIEIDLDPGVKQSWSRVYTFEV